MVLELVELDICELCRRFCGCTPVPRSAAANAENRRVPVEEAVTQALLPEPDVNKVFENMLIQVSVIFHFLKYFCIKMS